MKMTNSNKRRKQAICIASLLCLLSFLLLIHLGYEYKSGQTNEIILEDAKEDALQKANSAIKNINSELNSTSSLADGVAKDLSSGKLKNDSILRERLLTEMKNNPNIFSIVVAYSPAANAGKLYAPHFKRNGSEVVYAPLTYNYTKDSKQTEWYNDILKKGSKVWISPYFGIADRNYQIDYSAPFYLAESGNRDKAAGVVSVSHSLEGIREYLNSLSIGNTGYGFIISGKGEIISYPIKEYLNGNIHELAKKDPNLYFINENIKKTELLGDKFLYREILLGISKKYSFYRLDSRVCPSSGRNFAEQKNRADPLYYSCSVRNFCFFIFSVPAFCIHLHV